MTGRLLLFTTGDFPSKEAQMRAENWINRYVDELSKLEISSEFFDPWNSKIHSNDLVQVFGFSQKENWQELKLRCRGVLVTAWPETVSREDFFYPKGWKLWMDRLRKKCFPQMKNFESIFHSVDLFFLNPTEFHVLRQKLQGGSERIFVLPQDPKELAGLVRQAIQRGIG